MQNITWQARLRYGFDNLMGRGAGALIGLLSLASLAFITLFAVIVTVFGLWPESDKGPQPQSFLDTLWGNLIHVMDSGAIGNDSGWGFRAVMLLVTLGGLSLVASLIGIISSAFDSKVEDLRKGKSRVLESDHTLILGWNPQIFEIVKELCLANESRVRAAIVVLAHVDKVEMEDAIRAKLPRTGRTRIICRSGDPMDLTDLELGSPHTARSIIVLATDGSSDPDSEVIKTTLALTNNPRRSSKPFHIVGEIQSASNLDAARLVGRGEAHFVLAGDVISRIMVQTSRQSGLSVVYTELLDFGGDEIYFTQQPTLSGKSYLEAQLSFRNSVVMGLVREGAVQLNPAPDTVLLESDSLIVIAEDDSTIKLGAPGQPDLGVISNAVALEQAPERTLILGSNAELPTILHELSQYVTAGSSVHVVADTDDLNSPELESYPNLSATFEQSDTTSRATLERLEPHRFDHIMVLAYKDTLEMQQADARTLITLLHLRDIGDLLKVDMNVISEMLDNRNRELAEITKADDFIVGNTLISLMLSQVSENRQLAEVFAYLFSAQGAEIYLRPFELYLNPGSSSTFYSVVQAAAARGETALGYRRVADAFNSKAAYGVKVNPDKLEALSFGPGDKVIVLSEG